MAQLAKGEDDAPETVSGNPLNCDGLDVLFGIVMVGLASMSLG